MRAWSFSSQSCVGLVAKAERRCMGCFTACPRVVDSRYIVCLSLGKDFRSMCYVYVIIFFRS
jgi:hypothetical protein